MRSANSASCAERPQQAVGGDQDDDEAQHGGEDDQTDRERRQAAEPAEDFLPRNLEHDAEVLVAEPFVAC